MNHPRPLGASAEVGTRIVFTPDAGWATLTTTASEPFIYAPNKQIQHEYMVAIWLHNGHVVVPLARCTLRPVERRDGE